jgi:transposase
VLVPALRARPGAAVVMDNLAAHKAAAVRGTLDRAEVGCRHLPAYSPDMNPIEQAWSRLKAHLRAKAAGSREALERAIPAAPDTVTPTDARGWFRHCGYQPA